MSEQRTATNEQYVYTLSDPRDHIIHYVGITNNPGARLSAHLSDEKTNPMKVAWIQQLLSEGVKPLMEIIETVDDRDTVMEREHYWMEYYYDEGMPLTNIAYAPYQDISALRNAIEQERVRRLSHPEDAPDRWIERLSEKESSWPWHELIELTPTAISVLLLHVLNGPPSIVDRSVRIFTQHIKYMFPYIQHLDQIISLYENMNAMAHRTGRSIDEIALYLLTPKTEGNEP